MNEIPYTNAENQELSDEETRNEIDKTSDRERSTSVNEAMEHLAQLTDRLDKEEEPLTTDSDLPTNLNTSTNGNVTYANLVIGPETISRPNDLIDFDSDENDKAHKVSESEQNENKDEEDEPNPDYDIKAVRFHSEVLDADENKLQPLRVKEEETKQEEEQNDAADADGEGTDVSENTNYEEGEDDIDTTAINDPDTHFDKDNQESEHEQDYSADGEKTEEEINSPEMNGQFYFAEEASTYF